MNITRTYVQEVTSPSNSKSHSPDANHSCWSPRCCSIRSKQMCQRSMIITVNQYELRRISILFCFPWLSKGWLPGRPCLFHSSEDRWQAVLQLPSQLLHVRLNVKALVTLAGHLELQRFKTQGIPRISNDQQSSTIKMWDLVGCAWICTSIQVKSGSGCDRKRKREGVKPRRGQLRL